MTENDKNNSALKRRKKMNIFYKIVYNLLSDKWEEDEASLLYSVLILVAKAEGTLNKKESEFILNEISAITDNPSRVTQKSSQYFGDLIKMKKSFRKLNEKKKNHAMKVLTSLIEINGTPTFEELNTIKEITNRLDEYQERILKIKAYQKSYIEKVNVQVRLDPLNKEKGVTESGLNIDSLGTDHYEYSIDNFGSMSKEEKDSYALSQLNVFLDIREEIFLRGTEDQQFHLDALIVGALLYVDYRRKKDPTVCDVSFNYNRGRVSKLSSKVVNEVLKSIPVASEVLFNYSSDGQKSVDQILK